MIIMSTLTAILTSLLRGNNVIGVESASGSLVWLFPPCGLENCKVVGVSKPSAQLLAGGENVAHVRVT